MPFISLYGTIAAFCLSCGYIARCCSAVVLLLCRICWKCFSAGICFSAVVLLGCRFRCWLFCRFLLCCWLLGCRFRSIAIRHYHARIKTAYFAILGAYCLLWYPTITGSGKARFKAFSSILEAFQRPAMPYWQGAAALFEILTSPPGTLPRWTATLYHDGSWGYLANPKNQIRSPGNWLLHIRARGWRGKIFPSSYAETAYTRDARRSLDNANTAYTRVDTGEDANFSTSCTTYTRWQSCETAEAADLAKDLA